MASLTRLADTVTRAPILRSLRRRVPQVASAKRVWASPMPSQGAEQDIGHGGEPQAQLIGAHRGGRGAVGGEIALAFLQTVLRVRAVRCRETPAKVCHRAP